MPTGVVVECQEGRSQHETRRLPCNGFAQDSTKANFKSDKQAQAAERKSQVSTGDRSAKIRTYNYPQGRVTDHRIGLHFMP